MLATLLLALLVWGVYFATQPRYAPIRAVTVKGQFKYLSVAQLERVVAEQIGDGFFRVDLAAVRHAVLGLPWVRDVSVRRQWPGRLSLAVQEREAVARWGDSGALVDTQGRVFRPLDAAQPPDLPRFDGLEGGAAEMLAAYRDLRGLFARVGRTIRALSMDARRAWRLELDGATQVHLGHVPGSAALRHFVRAMPALAGHRGQQMERVDLRYPNGFAIRWRPVSEDAQGEGQ